MSKITFEKDFARHPLHYFTLLSVEMVGLWGIFWFSYQPQIQLFIISIMSGFYVAWGIAHHLTHRDLRIGIVLEYILMAILAVLIFGSLLVRA
jgi:hypothetical protein